MPFERRFHQGLDRGLPFFGLEAFLDGPEGNEPTRGRAGLKNAVSGPRRGDSSHPSGGTQEKALEIFSISRFYQISSYLSVNWIFNFSDLIFDAILTGSAACVGDAGVSGSAADPGQVVDGDYA